jgi:hypothetical protein
MTLTEFTAMIKDEANKGDRLDLAIPSRIEMAARRGERRYSLKYMERYTTLSLDPDATEPRQVAFPTDDATVASVKSVNFMRYLQSSIQDNIYIPMVDPTAVYADLGGPPEAYWLSGVNYIWFDNTVTEALELEFSYNAYSVWPPVSDEHWLLTNAPDWMLGETMKLLSTKAKEPSWLDKYNPMLKEAAADLFRADNELRNGNVDYVMGPQAVLTYRNRYPNDDGN